MGGKNSKNKAVIVVIISVVANYCFIWIGYYFYVTLVYITIKIQFETFFSQNRYNRMLTFTS